MLSYTNSVAMAVVPGMVPHSLVLYLPAIQDHQQYAPCNSLKYLPCIYSSHWEDQAASDPTPLVPAWSIFKTTSMDYTHSLSVSQSLSTCHPMWEQGHTVPCYHAAALLSLVTFHLKLFYCIACDYFTEVVMTLLLHSFPLCLTFC